MSVTLASTNVTNVIDALDTAPWYENLGAAALLGFTALVLREIEKKYKIDSMILDAVVAVLAVGALLLAFRGVFGDN